MKVLNIITGIITILMFIFLLFPESLKEVMKMDPYKLGVLCVFVACLIYWIYSLITFLIRRRNPQKVLRNVKESVQVINDSERHYLVEGNICSHIPDPPTFGYLGSFFGFSWTDSKLMLPDDIKRKFVIGKQLPSILLHCPKTEAIKR